MTASVTPITEAAHAPKPQFWFDVALHDGDAPLAEWQDPQDAPA